MDIRKLQENLESRGFKVSCFDKKEDGAQYIYDQITGQKVGLGGSVTLDQMGMYEKLSENNEVLWHWRIPEGQTGADVLKAARSADVYLSSVNGIAETGEIVNIDNTGNRVAATLYGHKKVYLVAGVNKITPDLDSAIYRSRNIAAPPNARRLGKKTPCAVNADKCYDCKSPDRICRGLVVLWEAPMGCEYEVVLIGEELGY